jgi:hypothetical protein
VLDDIVSRGADVANVRVVSAVCAPPALKLLGERFPGLKIYTGVRLDWLRAGVGHVLWAWCYILVHLGGSMLSAACKSVWARAPAGIPLPDALSSSLTFLNARAFLASPPCRHHRRRAQR